MEKTSKSPFRFYIGLVAFLVWFLGSSYIVFSQRPVRQMAQDPTTAQSAALTINTPYTLEDVALHSTQEDCWSVINDGVYDLTSFVSRHPGGVKNILRICGIDGSDLFNRKHGRSKKANTALILLKIGKLKL
ncbi:MAG TPA: cytochrome b5-like heme/steroid binding domain-containing protein [Candidatus Gracilibacteria bacterium]